MGKRSNGEGHYIKLSSGSWRCQLMDGYKEDGKPKMKSFTAPTKSEVQQKVRSYLEKREAGITVPDSISFEHWATSWYEDYKTQVQPSTYDNYKYTLSRDAEYIDKLRITVGSQMTIQQLIRKLESQDLDVRMEIESWDEKKKRYTALATEVERLQSEVDAQKQYAPAVVDSAISGLDLW